MKRRYILRLFIICITLLIVASGCSKKPVVSQKEQMQIKNVFLPKEDARGAVEFTLFFLGGEEGARVVEPEERAVKRDELLAYVLLNELIKGPAIKSPLKPLLPEGTKILNFSLRDDVGYVNLDGGPIKNMDVDENRERAIVEGIVKTLCQLPDINRVQIMVDNEKRETLAGHVDISKALSPGDFLVIGPGRGAN